MTYRYWLEREWGQGFPQVFVMLNPSTADETQDDPTIRRCISFAKRENAGGLIVVNLFALRATDPKELNHHPDPEGPENSGNVNMALLIAAIAKRPVICAWGANRNAKGKATALLQQMKEFDVKPVCFGVTQDGAPRHPLYVPAIEPLVEMKVR